MNHNNCTSDSLDSPLFEFSDTDGTAEVLPPQPLTAANLLRLMRERIKYYGARCRTATFRLRASTSRNC